MISTTDRIERSVLLQATRSRVWRAISNAEEFGNWFGVDWRGKAMKAGQAISGQVTYPGYEHLTVTVHIERLEPETLMSWRWHPAALDSNVDYSQEPMTLVTFELKDVEGGTLLTVVESGFDALPPHRRANALRLNTEGWDQQMRGIAKHVAKS